MHAIGAHIPRQDRPRPSLRKVTLHTRAGSSAAVLEGDPYIARALADGAVLVRRAELLAPGVSREIPMPDAAANAERAAAIRARAAVAREHIAEQAESSELRRLARRAAAAQRREGQRQVRIDAGTDRQTLRRSGGVVLERLAPGRIGWLSALLGHA